MIGKNEISAYFCFVFFNFEIILAKLPDSLFGLKIRNLDHEYVRLLFDQRLDDNAQKKLSAQLTAVQICMEIERDFKLLDVGATNALGGKPTKKYGLLEMRKQFDELRAKIEQNLASFAMVGMCELLDFGQSVGKIKCQFGAQPTALGNVKLMKSEIGKRNYNCVELAQIGEGNGPIWLPILRKELSHKHYTFISSKLTINHLTKYDFSAWFSDAKIAGESELSHRFRTTGARGDFEQIKYAKTVLKKHLLNTDTFEKLLEVSHPITLAADLIFFVLFVFDVLTEEEFNWLVLGMFGDQSNHFLIWFEVFSLLGKILAFFRHFKNDETKRKDLIFLWERTVAIIDGLANVVANESMREFYSILDELLYTFGTFDEIISYKKLINSYENYLFNLTKKNGQFLQMFNENDFSREKLKQIFKMMDEGIQIISPNFWHFFEEFNLDDEGKKRVRQNDDDDDSYDVYIPNMYMKCPYQNETALRNGAEIDTEIKGKSPLLNSYYELLLQVKDEHTVTKNELVKERMRKLETDAAIWVYREKMEEEMMEMAEIVEGKSANFEGTMAKYKSEWDKVKTSKSGQSDDNEDNTTLCALHKLALAIVGDKALRENDQWNVQMNRIMEENESALLPKCVLFAAVHEHNDSWTNLDCADLKSASKYVEKVKMMSTWIDQIHFYAISKLIVKFVEFRRLFCYGHAKISRNEAKQRLSWALSRDAFNAIQAKSPEILNYGFLLTSQYADFVLAKLSHKSHTFWAQFYEAHIATPFLVFQISKMEKGSLVRIGNAKMRNELKGKIVEIKSQFYGQLSEKNPEIWRKNLCILVEFHTFLTEVFAITSAISVDKVKKWKPGCKNENDFKNAMEKQREIVHCLHFPFLTRILEPKPENECIRRKIMAIPGAMTRLWKMTTVEKVMAEKANAVTMAQKTNGQTTAQANFEALWYRSDMEFSVFGDNNLLASLYEKLLLINVDKNANETKTNANKMGELTKADLMVFVQWVEDRIGTARHKIVNNRTTISCAQIKKTFDNIYDSMFDLDQQHLMQSRDDIWQFVHKLKQHMEMNKNNLPFENEWETIAFTFFCDKGQQQNELLKTEEQNKFKKWVGHLHKNAIIKLIREEKEFGKNEAAKSKSVFIKSLMELVIEKANWEEIHRIFQENRTMGIASENLFDNLKLFDSTNSPTKSDKFDNLGAEEKGKTTKKKQKAKKKGKNKWEKGDENLLEKSEKDNLLAKNSPKTKKAEEAHEENDQKNEKEKEENIKSEKTNSEKSKENPNLFFEEIFEMTENCRGDFAGIKLSTFEKNSNLATHFLQFIEIILLKETGNAPCASLQLLHFGIYANEIFNRINLIKHLKEILPEINIDQNEKEWDEIKTIELSKVGNAEKLVGHLFALLKRIVAKMDKFEISSRMAKEEEQIVRQQLLFQKFAKFIIEYFDTKNWNKLFQRQTIAIANALFWPKNTEENAEMAEQTLENLAIFLQKYKKLDSQRKLVPDFPLVSDFPAPIYLTYCNIWTDKELFEAYQSDEFLRQSFDAKPKNSKSIGNLLYLISDGWQEIEFGEIMDKKTRCSNEIRKCCQKNERLEENILEVISKLRDVFTHWSDEVRFQMPVSFLLNGNSESLNTICMIPDGFKVTTKIDSFYHCNLKERQLCKDFSLFCVLCRDLRVQFVQILSDGTVSKLMVHFMGVRFTVQFVVMHELPFVPRGNYMAQQMQTLLRHFGDDLCKIIAESYLDYGKFEFEEEKSELLNKEMTEELFMTEKEEDDEDFMRKLDKIEQLSNGEEIAQKGGETDLDEIKENAKAKAHKIGQKMEKMKKMMEVLRDHGTHLKMVELLLTKNELSRIYEDKKKMNQTTLRNFRTAYAYLEIWAKKKQIFDYHFGHLNSQILLIMLTKVFLLFPGDVSVAFLVEKFFFIYSIWNWPLPLHLAKIDNTKKGELLSWSPAREWFDKKQKKNANCIEQNWLQMPIISPIFPEKNVANQIDANGAKKIKEEFVKAFKKMRRANKSPMEMEEESLEEEQQDNREDKCKG